MNHRIIIVTSGNQVKTTDQLHTINAITLTNTSTLLTINHLVIAITIQGDANLQLIFQVKITDRPITMVILIITIDGSYYYIIIAIISFAFDFKNYGKVS